jgi:uncharacterized circularly permuted ATP-grasp superfamily protein
LSFAANALAAVGGLVVSPPPLMAASSCCSVYVAVVAASEALVAFELHALSVNATAVNKAVTEAMVMLRCFIIIILAIVCVGSRSYVQ